MSLFGGRTLRKDSRFEALIMPDFGNNSHSWLDSNARQEVTDEWSHQQGDDDSADAGGPAEQRMPHRS
ncbi:hypothetical protein JGU71_26070 [Antrihabitans sp. YC3-6]|uniref:Uncharacterized protein n=1 Tax=Antrihabitans stalagmiti TaxID=2799499 RepID=A0A934U6W5_9NOCA|nr:hypothetical protein [Antrihabitans stalagmiti]MBJ8342363.1 hypothetical protein [Antrihabitans stalagmiti]